LTKPPAKYQNHPRPQAKTAMQFSTTGDLIVIKYNDSPIHKQLNKP